jgi:hypothetical protein
MRRNEGIIGNLFPSRAAEQAIIDYRRNSTGPTEHGFRADAVVAHGGHKTQ